MTIRPKRFFANLFLLPLTLSRKRAREQNHESATTDEIYRFEVKREYDQF